MTDDYDIDLTDPSAGGVFFVIEEDLAPLAAQGQGQGLFVARTSLRGCTGKEELLRRLRTSLRLPEDFGGNWDALSDCVRDLQWLPGEGYLLLFDHADDLRDANEEDFDVLLDILDEAAEEWQEDERLFFAFFAMPESAFNDPDF
ncbi:barstar family protein [Dyella sp. BiH032]|uniref:barstar family protein n=1 Tax=Dyella sp. BiH032 TaxID=3075430 RepID=UPI002893273D|nr:barstar family protein [Dyella sp. BiH032]WNL47726.1 barstar family protein [Dyella sp. BiH032]